MGQQCCTTFQTPHSQEISVDDLRARPFDEDEQKKVSVQVEEMKAASQAAEEKEEEEFIKEEDVRLQAEGEMKEENLDFHQLIHLFRKCLHEYKGHDIEEACAIIREIEALKQSILEKRSLTELQFKDQVRTIEEEWLKGKSQKYKMDHYDEEVIANLKQQLQDMYYYEKQITKAPFIEKYNSEGIKISTRDEQNTIGAFIQSEIHIPFEYLAAILTQVPYFIDFIPYCEQSILIKDQARNNKIGYGVLNLPFVSRRQAYFQGAAYFRMKKHKEIFIYTRSIQDNPELQKLFNVQCPINKDYVQLNYKYFVVRYKFIREGVGKLEFAFNIDNGIHFLPKFVEDLVVREFGKKIFKKILSISKKFQGSKWQVKVKQNPAFFDFVRQRVKEMLKDQPEK